jgi:hypothetical protein
MSAQDHLRLVRDAYGAYESGHRSVVEELLTEDFTFYSPADVGTDRARYFERCWPNAELIEAFEFKRLIEPGDEIVVTYESTKTDGAGFAIPRSAASGEHGRNRDRREDPKRGRGSGAAARSADR